MRQTMANLITRTKLLTVLAIVLTAGTALLAAPVWHQPIILDQPDGSSFQCFVTGDEFYHRVYDAGNYTVVRDPASGYCVYAVKAGESLAPSQHVAGRADPSALGLAPGLDISAAEKSRLRQGLPYMANDGSKTPSTGTINNLVVFIRFKDQTEFADSAAKFDRTFNNAAAGYNSLRNFFLEASYSTLTVSTTFYPLPGTFVVSYQDTFNRSYYCPYDISTAPDGYTGGNNGTQRREREHGLLKRAVEFIASQVPPGLTIDSDGDGYVDNVCFVVRGPTTAWATLLWSHRWVLWTYSTSINGKQVWDYNFQMETQFSTSVLCHEMGHSVGYPDLYHYYYGTGLNPCGPWDIMDGGGSPPPHMGAYMKSNYTGWLGAIPEITVPGTYWLKALASGTSKVAYRIDSPYSSSEYFVVEYRRKAGTFEGSLPGSGLLAYRINSDFADQGNADYNGTSIFDEVYIYRPGGTPSANGNPSTAYFSSASGRTAINDGTNPSSFLHDGSAGGLAISAIGTAGDSIPFTVTSLTGVEEEPITAAAPLAAPGQVRFSPNPTASKGQFSFQVSAPGRVRIAIYSVTGQLVRVVADGRYQAGSHRAAWDGRDGDGRAVAAGVYVYRTTNGGYQNSGRIAVVK